MDLMCGELLSARPNSRIQYSASTRNTTPLDYEVLPSPPRTIEVDHSQTRLNRLLQHAETLKREAEARSTSSLTQLKVDTADRVEVYDRIELIWARFDCDPEHFTLRMPSPPHEILATSLAGSIAGGISDIGRDNIDAREFTSQLRPEGSARIIFPYKEKQEKQKKHKDGDSISERVRRQPDGQFRHGRAKFPGVVIEVSYSQDGKQLSSLAKQYINYSDGNIKAVICVDINYGRQESTISLWKARFTSILESDDPDEYLLDYESVIEKEPFRTADGQPLDSQSTLTLQLHDFAPEQLCEGVPNIPIHITFGKICEFVSLAEKGLTDRESKDAGGIQSTRRVRKRQLSDTSDEHLRTSDEERFRAMEKAVDIKASHGDGFFVPQRGDAGNI